MGRMTNEAFLQSILLNISVDPAGGAAECYPSRHMVVFKPSVLLDKWASFDCFQFVIPLAKFPSVIVDDQVVRLNPFQVFPINPGQKHRAEEFSQGQHYLSVFFSAELLSSLSLKIFGRSVRRFSATPSYIAASLLPLVKMYMRESMEKQPGFPLIQETLSIQIGTILLRLLVSDCRVEALAPASVEERLAITMEFMAQCYDERITLKDLADLAHMSPFYFHRSFKKYCGKTPHQYLTDLRLDRVKELLRSSSISITEACHQCGFDYGNHFSAIFKRSTGYSPRQYRHLELKKKQDSPVSDQ